MLGRNHQMVQQNFHTDSSFIGFGLCGHTADSLESLSHALRVLKGFLVAIVGQIQPHSVTLAAHRGIVGQDMENNHMPGILVKPGQIHVVMPFVILSTGTDSGFLHELGNRLSCHSGTCVPDPLR